MKRFSVLSFESFSATAADGRGLCCACARPLEPATAGSATSALREGTLLPSTAFLFPATFTHEWRALPSCRE